VHQEPRRDPDGRPLAVTLRTASGVQDGVEASPSSVRLDSPASGLRFTGSCVGSPGTTGFVLVNGRVTARLECGGAAADVVVPAVSRDGNLEYDQPVTVTVRLAASGADGLPDFAARVLPPATAQVDVYSSAGVAPSPAAASVSSRGPGRPVVPVLLAGQTVPLGAGPHAFSVVVGSDRFDIADRCRAPATKAPLWVHLTVNGRPVTSATCGTGDTGATLVGRTPGTLTASDLGVVVGRPATVTFQLSTAADRIVDPPDDHGDGDVGFAVYGVPYVPPSLARPAPSSGSSAGASGPTVSAP
jgi:hypothetical protein